MERKLFIADAFPHHETCTCKSCLSENEIPAHGHHAARAKSKQSLTNKNPSSNGERLNGTRP